MPPIAERGHDHDQGDDEDDDDGMPPLVENSTSNPPITYTFYSEMTPASFSTSSSPALATFQHPQEPHLPHTPQTPQPPPEQPIASSSSTIVSAPPRGSHGKKRDASYIPRPPNAFILYRSSFIKSQQVTDKVEGNHSNLSKIIGKYWKTLPQAERDEWEAKAVLAQAEHRARYPDWRFRPGANALAKLKAGANADARTKGGGTTRSRVSAREKGKAKEAGKGKEKKGKEKAKSDVSAVSPDLDTDTNNGNGPSKRRRVTVQAKDPPRSRSGSGVGLDIEDEEDRAGGENGDDDAYEPPTEEPKRKRGRGASVAGSLAAAGSDTRKTAMDTRCAKIVDLLGEGKKGVALEVAVKEWEGSRKRSQKQPQNEAATVQDLDVNTAGGNKRGATETSPMVSVEQGADVPSANSTVQTGSLSAQNVEPIPRNPPHLLIPPQHTYDQPSPTSTSVHMLSPTRSPASSYTQPASPYTQNTASPYTQTPVSASPYALTPPSPYINSAPAYSQHSRSKSLYGRFPVHEAASPSADAAPPATQSSHSQPHHPTYTRAARSSPGEARSAAQYTPVVQNNVNPQHQRPLDLATYTADALARGTSLTQLFRRSLSAPASDNRLAYPAIQGVSSREEHSTGDTEVPGRAQARDGPVEPSRGALNPTFSPGPNGGYPSNSVPQEHVDARTSAHPQHVYTGPQQNTYSTPHLPAFPHTHELHQHPQSNTGAGDVQRQQASPTLGANPSHNSPVLTWMDEEHRRRLEAAREHGYWWDGNEEEVGGTDADAEGDVDEAVGDEGLGYEDASNKEFDAAYTQNYSGSESYIRDDGRSGWTSVAGRHGLIAALEDPYLRRKSRSRSTTPPSKSQPLPSAPIPPGELPLSEALMASDQYPQRHPLLPPHAHQLESQRLPSNNYFTSYHHSISAVTPVPKSSFSTLAGWDGGSGSQSTKWTSGSGWEPGVWGMGMSTGTLGWDAGGGEAERGRELTRDGQKVMFSVAEEDEGSYGYGYRIGEVGIGTEMRGVDRGTGMLYDDEDDGGSDMVVGSPLAGQ